MRTFLMICLAATVALVSAQAPVRQTSADIFESLKKLNVLASVLYVAAHPDDENTNLISYLNNGRHYETRYLSVTRGDGGQNLIGTELRDLLGVLRTEELLAARRIDGGNQSFSRANDFGYSKNPEESLRIWDSTAVLADVVWAVRMYQPDVIINRFWHTTERPNHGHHTASAQLAMKAFDLAADPKAFPEQLKYVPVWQAKRNLCNMSYWFYGSQEAFDKIDKTDFVSMDIGAYYPSKGKSNREIAAESRSQHRCQAMGTVGERGEYIEWFKHLKGDQAKGDLFSGIDTTWGRVEGGAPIQKIIDEAIANYRFDNPAASVDALVRAYQLMSALPNSFWKRTKMAETRVLIQACMGLYLEATADTYAASAGDMVNLNIEATLRSSTPVTLTSVRFDPSIRDTTLNLLLLNNKANKFKTRIKLPETLETTGHYWLKNTYTDGMYKVDDQQLRGLPRTPHDLKTTFVLTFASGTTIEFPVEIAYKWEEPSRGEVWRPFEVTPPVFVNLSERSYMITDAVKGCSVKVDVQAGRNNMTTTVTLDAPKGWSYEPKQQTLTIAKNGETQQIQFHLSPPEDHKGNVITGQVTAVATVDGKPYSQEVVYIKYDHIPTQTITRPAVSKAVFTDIQRGATQKVGYIAGAGDAIPACLQQIGYQVTMLTAKDMQPDILAQFDAVVLGIRAYNTQEWLAHAQVLLHKYAENGGTLIVQYNTNFDLFVTDISPLKMKLGRGRVTDENAEMRFLLPEHPALNTPNKLTVNDFAGWTQERGIYFPSEWDAAFAAPISCNDPTETPQNGSLIIAPYGKGHFVYTGLVFFRELPAGVPGAYRLFANLLAL